MSAVRFFEAALFFAAALGVTFTIVFKPLAVTRISDLEVANQIQMLNSSGPTITAGAGDPNGSITAAIGSMRMQTDVAAIWLNTDGATAWSAL